LFLSKNDIAGRSLSWFPSYIFCLYKAERKLSKEMLFRAERSEIQRIIPQFILIVRPSDIYILNLEALDIFHDDPGCTVINNILASRSVVYQPTWIICPSSASQIHATESQVAQ